MGRRAKKGSCCILLVEMAESRSLKGGLEGDAALFYGVPERSPV